MTCQSKITKIVPFGNPRRPPRHHLENLFWTTSIEPKGQLTRNLVGSIEATCRSKIAKIVQIGKPRWLPWPPSWKIILNFFLWTKGQFTQNLVGSIKATCRSKIAKIVQIGNPRWPRWPYGLHLENQFWTSSPEREGSLARNLVGRIRAGYRSIKIAKIFPILNPRCRQWWPSLKCILNYFSRMKIYSKLVGKYEVDL